MPQDSNTTSATKTRRPGKIIAVGGAKGGIGKSLFVANLGVLLSQLGKRTVVVDLDLGGSNLHLYMGVWSLSRRIDDYLEKKVATISEIITPTKFGPQLIGGGGGKLGAANIHFSRKIKLLRSLKTIDADYVILDLGGDTTFNILDFYLAADQGFVLTTCEPASYLDAYGFLKMSLHRRLTRLFGADLRALPSPRWRRRGDHSRSHLHHRHQQRPTHDPVDRPAQTSKTRAPRSCQKSDRRISTRRRGDHVRKPGTSGGIGQPPSESLAQNALRRS